MPQGNHGPTVTDAFKFDLRENALADPEKARKQEGRLRRQERHLLAVAEGDNPLAKLTKENARAWRERSQAAGLAYGTIQRESNDINSAINCTNREWDGASDHNPFKGLKIGQPEAAAQTERDPLPKEVIARVYKGLELIRDLLAIWTLLDWTGARPSEVRMLLRSEVVTDADSPHFVIQKREGRSLKNPWSVRIR